MIIAWDLLPTRFVDNKSCWSLTTRNVEIYNNIWIKYSYILYKSSNATYMERWYKKGSRKRKISWDEFASLPEKCLFGRNWFLRKGKLKTIGLSLQQTEILLKFLKNSKFETLLHNNVIVVAMKENSGGQTQFVENSHGGEDILNFIAFIPRYKTDNDYFRKPSLWKLFVSGKDSNCK